MNAHIVPIQDATMPLCYATL